MKKWYKKKYEKYHPLSLAMFSNGWLVHLFSVEVVATGYCDYGFLLMWLSLPQRH